jgi:acyl-CoA synthetase (AMP-forming)/AMP-acid ligase II
MIQRLAGDERHGLYMYEAFDEPPVFCSYGELYRRVAGCMERFRAQGVGVGTRVILPFSTSIDVIASFLALAGIGALTFSVKPADARGGRNAVAWLQGLCRRFRVTHAVDCDGGDVGALPVTALDPAGARADAAVFAQVDDQDNAFIQFSSGSTSDPKGIPVTRRHLETHLRMLVEFDGRTRDDVYVSWLPLYHDLGLILGLLTSVYARNDLHLAAPIQLIRDPMGWLDLLSARRATLAATPYFAINYCLNHMEQQDGDAGRDWDFSVLRSLLIGSDPTNFGRTIAFQERLARHGLRRTSLSPAYGMAEAVLVVSSMPIAAAPWAHTLADGRQFISTGGLLPGFEARLTREDGSLCAEGELGQVELRGGTMAAGYFEEPDRACYNADGFFETGDLAYQVAGQLVIAGRAGDRIKVNGQTLFASEFEFAAQTLEYIKPGRVVVFQLDDRIILLAQVGDEAILGAAEEHRRRISQAIARALGVKLAVADIVFIAPGQIAKTSSGKLRRRAMAQAFLDGRLRLAACRAPATHDFQSIPTPTPTQEAYLEQ